MDVKVVEVNTKPKAKDRDGIYKRRDYWHYELAINGKKRSFTTGTKDYNEAKKIRAAAVRGLEEGRPQSDTGRKRLDVAADEYLNFRRATTAAGTLRIEKERSKALLKGFGSVMLKDITSRSIRSYQAARATAVSNRTVNLETKLLRGILKHEGQWLRLESDYARLQESSESPGRALTPEESASLFTVAESNSDWFVAYNAAVLANDSGMRGVELRNLRLRDVDITSRKIMIRRSKLASSQRPVVLTEEATAALGALVERANAMGATEPEHYLFPYKVRKGSGYDPTRPTGGWRKAWRKLTIAAGVPGFRFHDLRHTFITSHAEIGTPLSVVMAQAGHLSRRMSELYTHISQRALEEASERFAQRKNAARAQTKKTGAKPEPVHVSVHKVSRKTLKSE